MACFAIGVSRHLRSRPPGSTVAPLAVRETAKFFTTHVLKRPWSMPNLIKPPKTQRLPDIVTADEAQGLFLATRVLSYRVFYFTVGQRSSATLAEMAV
jgi:hypothetical protein